MQEKIEEAWPQLAGFSVRHCVDLTWLPAIRPLSFVDLFSWFGGSFHLTH